MDYVGWWGTKTAHVERKWDEYKPLPRGVPAATHQAPLQAPARQQRRGAQGRGLHSFTLELNLSNSRTD
jgi:hypothetical protein